MKNKALKYMGISILSLTAILAVTIVVMEYFSNYKSSTTIHLEAPVITKKGS